MRASYKLLKSLVSFDLTPEELRRELTFSGSEVEGVEKPSEWISDVVVAEIREVVSNTPRTGLSLCTVFDGSRVWHTVSGAPNIIAGTKAAFVRPGGKLFGNVHISTAVIDGMESEGMLCSGAELGLGNPKDKLLPICDDIPTGSALVELFGWNDETIYEFEITPNRPDCYGHWGLAREIAALCNCTFEPVMPGNYATENGFGTVDIEIETPNCTRYCGTLVEGICVKPSPLWLQGLLAALGMRPINNIVDITNYIMLLTGQPIHAFDEKKLGRKIIVRQAKNAEKIVTLDGIERTLDKNAMLITSPHMPVAVAGVMGAANSEISDDTKDIIVEVAHFVPSNVRRTKKMLGLITESATRFERGVDPNIQLVVSSLVTQLCSELADAHKIHQTNDVRAQLIEPILITVSPANVTKLLGKHVENSKIREILTNLGLDLCAENAGGMVFRVPTFRPDLTREADLIEEIGRIYGLNNIEPNFRAQGIIGAEIPSEVKLRHSLEDLFCGMGLRNAMTDPLGSRAFFERFADAPLVELLNPLSDELAVMRPNVAPGLIACAATNIKRGARSVALFEIDNGYKVVNYIHSEQPYVSIALAGMREPISWCTAENAFDLFDIKAIVESAIEHSRAECVFEPFEHTAVQNGTGIAIFANGKKIGFAGVLARDLCDKLDVKREIYFAVFELLPLVENHAKTVCYKPFSRFPAIRRDVALILHEHFTASDLLNAARVVLPQAEEMGIFDMYRGKPIPEGKKSLGLYFVFRANDHTLSDDEVNAFFEPAVRELCTKFDAEVRK